MQYLIGRQKSSPVDFNRFKVYHDSTADQLILFQNDIYFTLDLLTSKVNDLRMLSKPISKENRKYRAAPISVSSSIDKNFVAVQRYKDSAEIYDINDGRKWIIKCKSKKNNTILNNGIIWCDLNAPSSVGNNNHKKERNAQNLVLVTNNGLELYRIDITSSSVVKFLNLFKHNLHLFWWDASSHLLLISSMDRKVLRGYVLNTATPYSIQKFSVPSPADQRSVHPVQLYGNLYALFFTSKKLLVYSLTSKKAVIIREYPLYNTNKFAYTVNVVDNIIVLHDIYLSVSILYDIKLDDNEPIVNALPLKLLTSSKSLNDGAKTTSEKCDASLSSMPGGAIAACSTGFWRDYEDDLCKTQYIDSELFFPDAVIGLDVEDTHIGNLGGAIVSNNYIDTNKMNMKSKIVRRGSLIIKVNSTWTTNLSFDETVKLLQSPHRPMQITFRFPSNPFSPDVEGSDESPLRSSSNCDGNMMYSDERWKFFPSKWILDYKLGVIWELRLDSLNIARTSPDPVVATSFLLRRFTQRNLYLSLRIVFRFLRDLIRDRVSQRILSRVFFAIHSILKSDQIPAKTPSLHSKTSWSWTKRKPRKDPTNNKLELKQFVQPPGDAHQKTRTSNSLRSNIASKGNDVKVYTLYGPGVVRRIRSDGVYEVQCAYGMGYLQLSAFSRNQSKHSISKEVVPQVKLDINSIITNEMNIALETEFGGCRGGRDITEDLLPQITKETPSTDDHTRESKPCSSSDTVSDTVSDTSTSSFSTASDGFTDKGNAASTSDPHNIDEAVTSETNERREVSLLYDESMFDLPLSSNMKSYRSLNGYILVLHQLDLSSRVLLPVASMCKCVADFQFLKNTLISYFRSIAYHSLPAEPYIGQLLVQILIRNRNYKDIYQLFQYKIIPESICIAEILIESSIHYPPLFNVGMDVLMHIQRFDRIVEALLKRKELFRAIKVMTKYLLNPSFSLGTNKSQVLKQRNQIKSEKLLGVAIEISNRSSRKVQVFETLLRFLKVWEPTCLMTSQHHKSILAQNFALLNGGFPELNDMNFEEEERILKSFGFVSS